MLSTSAIKITLRRYSKRRAMKWVRKAADNGRAGRLLLATS